MSLSKEVIVDKVEVVGAYNHVQIREATVVTEDGAELSRSFHRKVISPGDDYSAEDPKVQAVCAAVHTQEVIDAYAAHQASQGA